MEATPITVLLVEDNPADARSIGEMLADSPDSEASTSFNLVHSGRLETGLAHLVRTRFDVILLDLTLPDSEGISAISIVRTMAPNVPIISLTDVEDELLAVEAMQQGTQDYLAKDTLSASSLIKAIRYAIERQRLVAELAQKAAELQTRNKELDEFAHTVAHQIQGLLSQMVGYAGYIEANYAPSIGDEVVRLLRRILQSGHKMNNVISELLLLASVRTGEVINVPLNMGRLVSEAQKRMLFQIEEFEGVIIKPEDWPVAIGYPSWVEEVWVNYISNGLKYGGPSPRITLGADSQKDGMIRFWVRDEGQGISASDQRRLFMPHTRLRQIRARGDGLGLFIVYRIVDRLGGSVGVSSEVGEGSTFWFTLPAVDTRE